MKMTKYKIAGVSYINIEYSRESQCKAHSAALLRAGIKHIQCDGRDVNQSEWMIVIPRQNNMARIKRTIEESMPRSNSLL